MAKECSIYFKNKIFAKFSSAQFELNTKISATNLNF